MGEDAILADRDGMVGVDKAPELAEEVLIVRRARAGAGPEGVIRWRLDEALRAGESGRYRARAVRMNVCEVSLSMGKDGQEAYIRILVVYTTQSSSVEKELVQHPLVHPVSFGRYDGSFRQDNLPRCSRVGG